MALNLNQLAQDFMIAKDHSRKYNFYSIRLCMQCWIIIKFQQSRMQVTSIMYHVCKDKFQNNTMNTNPTNSHEKKKLSNVSNDVAPLLYYESRVKLSYQHGLIRSWVELSKALWDPFINSDLKSKFSYHNRSRARVKFM